MGRFHYPTPTGWPDLVDVQELVPEIVKGIITGAVTAAILAYVDFRG